MINPINYDYNNTIYPYIKVNGKFNMQPVNRISGVKPADAKGTPPISSETSYAAAASHEQGHVSNAMSKGSQPGNELVSASMRLRMGICPEYGKPYATGVATVTQMKYNLNNPYETERKSIEGSLLKGINFDAVA